jgi:hypothetical protein
MPGLGSKLRKREAAEKQLVKNGKGARKYLCAQYTTLG